MYVKDAEGVAVEGAKVFAKVMGSGNEAVHQNGGGALIEEVVEHSAASTGLVTLSLPANALLIPANSYYRIRIEAPSERKARVLNIVVPNGAGPYDIEDTLHEPGTVDESALAAHRATIKTHDDVSDTAPTAGQVLIWDGTNWTPGDTVATDIEAASLVTAHSADSTAVHGIADTALLETTTGAQTKADTAESDAIAAAASDATTKANQAETDANAYTDAEVAILDREKVDLEGDKKPVVYPVFGEDLTRYASNPVIEATDVDGTFNLAADPHLLVVEDKLYCFFECGLAPLAMASNTRIYVGESTDGRSFGSYSQISHDNLVHYSHPQALIHNGHVHVFYNEAGASAPSGRLWHRSMPVEDFPGGTWSTAVAVFDPAGAIGWPDRFVECAILEHEGIWYLLAIIANNDKRLWGRWCGHFTMDWVADGQDISSSALIDLTSSTWLSGMVEITPLQLGGRLLLTFGGTRVSDSKQAIVAFSVSDLSPSNFAGAWLKKNHTFGLNPIGGQWDSDGMHRASIAAFGDEWIVAYDGHPTTGAVNDWKIGLAYMPLDGESAVYPSGLSEALQPAKAPASASFVTMAAESGLSGETLLSALFASGTNAARPAAGVAGRIYQTTDNPRALWMDTGTEWILVGPMTVALTGDYSHPVSNTALANIGIALPVKANTKYFVEVFLRPEAANNVMDAKAGFSVPAGTSMSWGLLSTTNTAGEGSLTALAAGSTPAVAESQGGDVTFGTAAGKTLVSLAGWIEVAGTAGDVNVKVAQNTSDAGLLKILATSFARLTRLT